MQKYPIPFLLFGAGSNISTACVASGCFAGRSVHPQASLPAVNLPKVVNSFHPMSGFL